MIRDYDELTQAEKTRLEKAWIKIRAGLQEYEEVTGANLEDHINFEIWYTVQYQKEEGQE